MECAIAICKKLAVEIIEASKLTPLEELLSEILSFLIEECGSSSFEGTDSRNEETSSGSSGVLFGKSELEGELNSSQEDEKNSINQKNHSTGDSPEKEECMDGLITAAKAASDDEIGDAVRDVYIGERLNKKR